LNESAFYTTPGPFTTLPADVAGVPGDVAGVRDVVPRLMVHTAWVRLYDLPVASIDARPTHTAQELVAEIRALVDEPLDAERAPVQRAGVVCRHFSTMAVSMLRRAGIPSRARCGFATYFEPGKHVDHWIVERHDGERWVRSDYQLDAGQLGVLGIDFDPDDLPENVFLDAGEAWARIRGGAADPETFGIFDMWGAWFVRGNVWRDLAALNNVEMNPWDAWGSMQDADDEFVDNVAEVARGGDFAERRARYEDDPAVRVRGRAASFLDGNRTTVDVPVD
jgi:hypothetical protein